MGNEEEREKIKKWWYQMRREAWKKMDDKMHPHSPKIFKLSALVEEITEEHNDVYIYKTLRYPPKSKPPIAN